MEVFRHLFCVHNINIDQNPEIKLGGCCFNLCLKLLIYVLKSEALISYWSPTIISVFLVNGFFTICILTGKWMHNLGVCGLLKKIRYVRQIRVRILDTRWLWISNYPEAKQWSRPFFPKWIHELRIMNPERKRLGQLRRTLQEIFIYTF